MCNVTPKWRLKRRRTNPHHQHPAIPHEQLGTLTICCVQEDAADFRTPRGNGKVPLKKGRDAKKYVCNQYSCLMLEVLLSLQCLTINGVAGLMIICFNFGQAVNLFASFAVRRPFTTRIHFLELFLYLVSALCKLPKKTLLLLIHGIQRSYRSPSWEKALLAGSWRAVFALGPSSREAQTPVDVNLWSISVWKCWAPLVALDGKKLDLKFLKCAREC